MAVHVNTDLNCVHHILASTLRRPSALSLCPMRALAGCTARCLPARQQRVLRAATVTRRAASAAVDTFPMAATTVRGSRLSAWQCYVVVLAAPFMNAHCFINARWRAPIALPSAAQATPCTSFGCLQLPFERLWGPALGSLWGC